MKKLVSLLLVAVMSLSLMACGGRTLEDAFNADPNSKTAMEQLRNSVKESGMDMSVDIKGNTATYTITLPAMSEEQLEMVKDNFANMDTTEMTNEFSTGFDQIRDQIDGTVTVVAIYESAEGEELFKVEAEVK